MNTEEFKCVVCNTDLPPGSPRNRKYCSGDCSASALKAKRETLDQSKDCLKCGTTFSYAKARPRNFCDKSCSASYSNTLYPKRTKGAPNQCCFCGVETHNPKYCSSKCAAANKQAETLNNFLNGEINYLPNTPSIYEHFLSEQGEKCAICEMEPFWNGNPLKLIKDHIDGNSENNNPSNIRLVCPNCDSQLPTYKAKNKGNGRHYRRQRYAEGKSF